MKKKILYGAIALLLSGTANAQDIHFSQFYETSILRNPSLIGIFPKDYKVSALYRNQWSSISKPYQTGLVTAEMRIPMSLEVNDFLSFGVLGYYDKAGSIDLQTVSVYPAINYNKVLREESNTFLSVGFTGGYIQRSFDPGKATFNNQYVNNEFNAGNPTGEQLPDPTFSYWDLGTGVTYSSSAGVNNSLNYTIGVAGYHLTTPQNSFYKNTNIRLDTRWNVNAGLTKQLDEIYSFQLHANYTLQGNYNEIIGGGLFGWNKKDEGTGAINFAIYGGVFYRVKDAFIPTLKLRYRDMNFAFSYDANTSKLKAATNLRGGFEICVTKIGWTIDPQSEKARTICPE
jgi:type IX secretion system PorP/SprF family membrane protein